MDLKQRTELLDSIRGQTVMIPDMRLMFKHYSETNPNYHSLVPEVDRFLESLIFNEKKLAHLKTADFALFGSTWWPKANFNRLRIVTFFAIWLFLWDDELDEPTGEHSDNLETAQEYREETIEFIRECLRLERLSGSAKSGLCQYLGVDILRKVGQHLQNAIAWTFGTRESFESPPTASNRIIESFRVIGQALAEAYSPEQRESFFKEINLYIRATETEQKWHLEAQIPSLEDYWRSRMGTSAVHPCLAMIELANGIRGPYASTTNEPSLTALCDEATKMVIISNDMLSLKKEINKGCIDSLIPLLCLKDGNLQKSINEAHRDLLETSKRFESEAERLLTQPNKTKLSDKELRVFVEGSRDCWVGNFGWSLCTGRYGLGSIDQREGKFSLTL